MNYQQALDYIYSFVDYETQARPRDAAYYDLRRVDELLEKVGNPHLKAKTVHLAGTKGKGSTAAMITSALMDAGYSTGLFTSPHLLTYNERIRVNDELISNEDMIMLTEKLQPIITDINERATYGKLTTFEIMTAMGFMYFEMKHVDFQVVEVGLGGRLDATNVVRPEVTVLTTIGYDHMEVLGDTLSLIAGEKAGIMKPGVTAVASQQLPDPDKVFEDRAAELGIPLIKVGRDVLWESTSFSDMNQMFRVKGRHGEYNLTIPLVGEHQLINAATAVAALEVLQDKGYRITSEHIVHGLANVKWPGRLQILQRKPLLVVDGAHTIDSARRARESLTRYFTFDKAILIIGSSMDKDITGMVNELAPIFDKVIVTRSDHPRAMASDRIIAEFHKKGVEGVAAKNVAEALPLALSMAGENDMIVATGSLFIVAKVLEEAQKRGIIR
jgi:dihydrofolate synthase/folylpolyglutamate synthase